MLIRIVKSPYSHGTTLEVNGHGVNIPPQGSTADIAEELLPALADSHIAYEIVAPARDEAGEGAGGTLGDAPAEIASDEPEVEETPDEDEELPDEDSETEDEAPVEKEFAEPKATVDLAILDDNVPNIAAKLPGLSPADLKALLDAEKAGKTRVTLISALEEALNPPQE